MLPHMKTVNKMDIQVYLGLVQWFICFNACSIWEQTWVLMCWSNSNKMLKPGFLHVTCNGSLGQKTIVIKLWWWEWLMSRIIEGSEQKQRPINAPINWIEVAKCKSMKFKLKELLLTMTLLNLKVCYFSLHGHEGQSNIWSTNFWFSLWKNKKLYWKGRLTISRCILGLKTTQYNRWQLLQADIQGIDWFQTIIQCIISKCPYIIKETSVTQHPGLLSMTTYSKKICAAVSAWGEIIFLDSLILKLLKIFAVKYYDVSLVHICSALSIKISISLKNWGAALCCGYSLWLWFKKFLGGTIRG